MDTLRFGGVDRTHNLPAATATTQSDTATVELGLPMFGGTRIVIDKSISGSQQAPPSTGSTTPRTVQQGVTFAVSGRLELFQANEVVGNAATPPGQFSNENPAASGTGGTFVASTVAGNTGFFTTSSAGVIKGGVGGAIGFVRVGGNATNFTVIAEDPTGQSIDRVSDFSVGGETNNVLLIAPAGANNVVFGKGMDTVEIRAHVINTLKANRGAINSNVAVDRQIGLVDIGGDVVNSRVLSGYVQNFNTVVRDVLGLSNSVFGGGTPTAPPLPDNAQPFGGMTVHVAGDITNSVFAASTQPFNGVFGGPNELVLPSGHINAKVEGSVNNAIATPDSPLNAFYAQKVKLNRAPVAPPAVPEPPYDHPSKTFLPGVHTANPSGFALGQSRTALKSAALHARASTPVVLHGTGTPRGPHASLRPKTS